ncbi:MAG: type IV pilus assembly protein PilM [Candidatus Muirbacterium halophilum]|nr:type IV pilus assembly protein PilM [Candidatus Muirbacterium halophilum]MCK9475086.1 type IV pilus assembly protein PilM [Candidatus Muirbacterium halophilum]
MLFGGGNSIIGIDVGSSAVKIVMLKLGKQPVLAGFGIAHLPMEGVIVEGNIVDGAAVTDTIKDVIKAGKLKGSTYVGGLLSQNTIIRFIKMPVMAADELKEAIKFEAEQYIPYSIDEVQISYFNLGEIAEEEGSQNYILLVCTPKEILNTYQITLKNAGVTLKVVDVDCFGVLNALSAQVDPDGIVAIIDIGASTTNIDIIKRGVLDFHRNVNIAGNNISNVIKDVLKLELSQAENIKKEEGRVAIEESDRNEVSDVINTIIEELVSEIRRSFDFFKAQSREKQIDKIILTGGTSKLPNIDAFLANELGIEVEFADPFVDLGVSVPNMDELEEYKQELTAAIGLGLREVVRK